MRRRDLLRAAPALMMPALARAQARPLGYIPNAGCRQSSNLDHRPDRRNPQHGVRHAVWPRRYGPIALPCIPLEQLSQPTAFRSDITDIVKAAFPLFGGLRRA